MSYHSTILIWPGWDIGRVFRAIKAVETTYFEESVRRHQEQDYSDEPIPMQWMVGNWQLLTQRLYTSVIVGDVNHLDNDKLTEWLASLRDKAGWSIDMQVVIRGEEGAPQVFLIEEGKVSP